MAQPVGKRAHIHMLTWAKRGDLRDRVEGVRCGIRVRGGNSSMWC